MTVPGDPRASPVATLRRINASRPRTVPGERCEMCSQPISEQHQHVVDLESRGLMCTCRGCYLLFTDQRATLRYRAVPDRYLSFPRFTLARDAWDDLQIPVGLVFVFHNSVQDRVVAFYPGPAGATESELPLQAWDRIVASDPRLRQLLPDVEALLVRAEDRGRGEITCHLVPIDACYELVGRMRATWRGFDGGQEARTALAAFFDDVDRRSRPAPEADDASPGEPPQAGGGR
jgi:hypothetical protein